MDVTLPISGPVHTDTKWVVSATVLYRMDGSSTPLLLSPASLLMCFTNNNNNNSVPSVSSQVPVSRRTVHPAGASSRPPRAVPSSLGRGGEVGRGEPFDPPERSVRRSTHLGTLYRLRAPFPRFCYGLVWTNRPYDREL